MVALLPVNLLELRWLQKSIVLMLTTFVQRTSMRSFEKMMRRFWRYKNEILPLFEPPGGVLLLLEKTNSLALRGPYCTSSGRDPRTVMDWFEIIRSFQKTDNSPPNFLNFKARHVCRPTDDSIQVHWYCGGIGCSIEPWLWENTSPVMITMYPLGSKPPSC